MRNQLVMQAIVENGQIHRRSVGRGEREREIEIERRREKERDSENERRDTPTPRSLYSPRPRWLFIGREPLKITERQTVLLIHPTLIRNSSFAVSRTHTHTHACACVP